MSGPRSVYEEALDWIRQHPGTGSAEKMAKLLLSLFNSQCGFAVSECVSGLDGHRRFLATKLIAEYVQDGEGLVLPRVGREVAKLYPHLWEQGEAMAALREQLDEKRRAAAQEAEQRADYQG